MTDPTVVVVGAGPAGLSAARELACAGLDDVLVVERESEAGGVPRHCHHTGFGLEDLRRSQSGPAYARRLTELARAAGADIRCSSTVLDLGPDGTVTFAGPGGIEVVQPRAVLLATGARERPRAARLVPGDRPAGVFTTGQLQQWTHLRSLPVGRRAVVVGAEHVAYSAVLTLRRAGVTTVAMVTELPRHQTVSGFALAMRLGLRLPLTTTSRVVGLHGKGRLEHVEIEQRLTGAVTRVAADTVVFTGDWFPDHALARRAGVAVDRTTQAPRVDGSGRTSRAGVLAAGNLVHPGETSGIAALGGRAAARRLAAGLMADQTSMPGVAYGPAVQVAWPLTSVVPSVVDPSDPPERLVVHTAQFTGRRLVVARQGSREIGRHRLRQSVPNRSLRLPGRVLGAGDPGGGPIGLSLV